MTYEPGQQVLVRGVVKRPDEIAVGEFLIETRDADGNADRQYVRAADIVGPAPATPDEGDDADHEQTIDELYVLLGGRDGALRLLRDQYQETRTALAAVEAERDALRARIAAALDLVDRLYNAGQLGAINAEWMIRRALSVEAAGTEGEGGHE